MLEKSGYTMDRNFQNVLQTYTETVQARIAKCKVSSEWNFVVFF